MKTLEIKINKLENEKAKKVEKKNQLEEEINSITAQLKPLKSLYSQFEKLEKEKAELLGTAKKQAEPTIEKSIDEPKEQENPSSKFTDIFNHR